MPYEIEEKEDRFILSNKNTGRVVAAHKTKAKAEAQRKALYASESGMERPKGKIILDGEE